MNRVRVMITTFSDTKGTFCNNNKQIANVLYHNNCSQTTILAQAQWKLFF